MITTFNALKSKQMNHGSPFAQIKLNDIRLKIRRMKSFCFNVGLTTQIKRLTQPGNKEITQSFGFHLRYAHAVKKPLQHFESINKSE